MEKAKKKDEQKTLSCTNCEGKIKIPEDSSPGEIVNCPDCGENFELVRDKDQKFSLKRAEQVGEDWGE